MVAERPGGDGSDAADPDGADGESREATAAPDVPAPAHGAAGAGSGLPDAPADLPEWLDGRLADRLEADERVRLCWTVVRRDAPVETTGSVRRDAPAGPVEGSDGAPATVRRTVYAATDRRLLVVEADRAVQSTAFGRRPAANPALTLGAGVVVAVLSFLGGVAAPSGWTALLLVVACAGGLALAEQGYHRWRAPGDRRDRPETAVSSVVVSGSPADVGAADADAGDGDGAEPTVTAFDVGGVPVPSAVVEDGTADEE